MRRMLLTLALLLSPVAANAQWREASTRHFLIYSEQSEADLRKSAEQLERFDAALRVQLRKPAETIPPATRLTIFILKDARALEQLLGNSSIAGIYMPRSTGSISFTYEDRRRLPRNPGSVQRQEPENERLNPRVVLFHEYTHHFLNHNFNFGAPLWFSEGFAEFWGPTQIDEDGSVRIGLVRAHRSGELSQLPQLTVQRIVTLRHPIESQMTFVSLYGYGWVLSHYLAFEPSRAGQLDRYLAALAQGRSAEQAAQAFGDLNQLDRELRAYVGRGRYAFATIPAAQINPGPIQVRQLRPGESAIMSVRMRSKRGVNESQAQALVPEARRAAAPYPNDPFVQATLAEVEYDAKNYAEAEAAAQRAIAADPKLVEAHLYRARAMQGRITKTAPPTPEQWSAIRAAILAGNRADPDDPEPLVAFYETFKAAGQQPTANAVQGLIYAQSLAPEDRTLRISAGREMLVAGKAAEAKVILGPIAGDTHSGELGAAVAEILDTLAASGTAAALVKLDAALERQEARSRRRG